MAPEGPTSSVPAFLPERLPLADQAVVRRSKVRDYLLDPGHPVGRHKARLWESILGFTRDDAEVVREALRAAAPSGTVTDCRPAQVDPDTATTWTVVLSITGRNGRVGRVKTLWHVRLPGAAPSLETAIPVVD